MAVPVGATLDEAKRAPILPGFRSAELMRHDTMVLRYDSPKGGDPQTPHRFESFSADFGTWVIFYGPKGGEHG